VNMWFSTRLLAQRLSIFFIIPILGNIVVPQRNNFFWQALASGNQETFDS
jgi:hypothetical protein